MLLLVASCANRAEGPTGGPRDSIPPVVIRSVPAEAAVNYRKKEIQVFFNENIAVEKVAENVFISPPQKTQPTIRGNGRLLSVELQDDLLDNTTYSLFFGSAIVDLNEKNPLKNFSFSFSTGAEIDTLQASGLLLNAETLEPLQGVIVGLHQNPSDSAIYKDVFVRATKTDEDGKFTIRNIREGQYRLYALRDQNRDYLYQTGEGVAFGDSLVFPTVTVSQRTDTLWKDSVNIDTVITRMAVNYKPDDLKLRLFRETKKRQFLRISERPQTYTFRLIFNDKLKELPVIKPLNFPNESPLLMKANQQFDSLQYWIRDPEVFILDTLSMAVSYFKTDSLFNPVPATDTVKLAVRSQRAPARTGNQPQAPPSDSPEIKTNIARDMDIFLPIEIMLNQPVDTVLLSSVRLKEKSDTVFNEVKYKWIQRDSLPMHFAVEYTWKPKHEYEFVIDSAAISSIYGYTTLKFSQSFKTKSPEDYSDFTVILPELKEQLVLQLLDSRENVVVTQAAIDKKNSFSFLKPGDYFLRAFIDSNRNGQWDPGDLLKRIQPEEIIYFPRKISLKANWEQEENWDPLNADARMKRPEELKKEKKK